MPVVTDFYEWGPWVNGGAWIHTAAGKVDFLYRNIDQVQATITDAINGIWQHHYEQQPSYGFRSVIYLAEIQICRPLHDPSSGIRQMKDQVAAYPPKLKRRIISDCLWLAEFTLLQAQQFAQEPDVYNATGCFTRAANYLVQALFAFNETYPLGDKRSLRLIGDFPIKPAGTVAVINRVLGQAGENAVELLESLQLLRALWKETVDLTGGAYQPKFML